MAKSFEISQSTNSPTAGFRNAIINGNFDIWQRGTSLGSGTALRYLADRWATLSVGTTYTASQQAFALGQTAVPGEPTYYHRVVATTSAGAGNYCLLAQRIEGVRSFAGQTITISFWAKADAGKPIAIEVEQYFGTGGSPSSVVDTFVSKPTLTTSWAKYTYTIAVPSISGKTLGTAGDYLTLNLWFDAGSTWNTRSGTLGQQSGTFDIAQVQLEPGLIATPFERRSIGAELSLCQRYFWVTDIQYGRGFTMPSGWAFMEYIPFPVTMRIVPTPNGTFTGLVGATGPAWGPVGTTGTRFYATSNATTGSGVYVNAGCTFDAEL